MQELRKIAVKIFLSQHFYTNCLLLGERAEGVSMNIAIHNAYITIYILIISMIIVVCLY